MPLLSKHRTVAAKIESVHGTAVSLSDADAIYVMEAKYESDVTVTDRPDDGTLGHRTAVVGARKAKITFKVELKGSGFAHVTPDWAAVLFPACGMAQYVDGTEALATWGPVSSPVYYSTVTIAVFEDGIKKSICGAMGSWVFEGESGKPASFTFTFEGNYIAPVDAAMPNPEADTIKPPPFQAAAFTLGGTLAPVSKVSIQQGNKVQVREDITSATGFTYAVVTERDYTGKINPEATLVATRNVFGIFIAGTEQAFSLTLGTVTGNIIQFTGPKVQHKQVAEGNRNNIDNDDIDLQFNKNDGDDELYIHFL